MTGTRNPVPPLIIGPSDPQETVNQSVQQWARQVSPVMWQAFSPITGTLPVPSAPSNSYLMEAGTPTVTFSAGAGTYTFPQPFPNGVLAYSAELKGTLAQSGQAQVGRAHVTSGSIGAGASLSPVSLASDITVGVTFASNAYKVVTPGYYLASSYLEIAPGGGTSYWQTAILHNGSGTNVGAANPVGGGGQYTTITQTDIVNCAVNDTLAMSAFNASAGGITINDGSFNVSLIGGGGTAVVSAVTTTAITIQLSIGGVAFTGTAPISLIVIGW